MGDGGERFDVYVNKGECVEGIVVVLSCKGREVVGGYVCVMS